MNVFDGLSDKDARTLHDASNMYADGSPIHAHRTELVAFREAMVEMSRRYDFGPQLAVPINAHVALVVGKSQRRIEEMRTCTKRFTPFLLECLAEGWVTSYAARQIIGWGREKGEVERIAQLSERAEAAGVSSKDDFDAALKSFCTWGAGLETAEADLRRALALVKKAARVCERKGAFPNPPEPRFARNRGGRKRSAFRASPAGRPPLSPASLITDSSVTHFRER